MITLTLTVEQVATLERALSNYDFDLYHHYERSAERDDEVRLVQEAIAVIGEQVAKACYAHRFVQDPPWDKTQYETYDDYLRSLGADY